MVAWKAIQRRNPASRAQPPHFASGQPHLYGEQKPYVADGNQAYEMLESDGNQTYMNCMNLLGDRLMNCMSLLGSLAVKESG